MSTNKVIIRWTIGTVSRQGAKCLKHSVKSFVDCYGQNFDFYICYNSIEKPVLNLDIDLKYIYQDKPILQGTGGIWKYTPARIDISKKELFIDNDIVFISKNQKLLNFFENDKFLLARDNVRYYGRFDNLFDADELLNAGLIGFPCNYDLGNEIKKLWVKLGSLPDIDSSEEQGLVAYLIKTQPDYMMLNDKDIVILNGYGDTFNIFGNEWLTHDTYHFVELNRKYHKYYQRRMIKLI